MSELEHVPYHEQRDFTKSLAFLAGEKGPAKMATSWPSPSPRGRSRLVVRSIPGGDGLGTSLPSLVHS